MIGLWRLILFASLFAHHSNMIEGIVGYSVIKGIPGEKCDRPCKIGDTPMVCEFKFSIEMYMTMSKACYDCPFNESHCSLPDCIAANGVPRTVMSINRRIPGPEIMVCENDTLEVTVINHSEQGITIHWHGIHNSDTPFMDGVPMITQCPISPYTQGKYRVLASQAGTHFYHSHIGMQRGDGIFGTIVVRKQEDRNSRLYDDDLSTHYILVHDWLDGLGVDKFVSHHHNDGPNFAKSMLINGKGIYEKYKRDGALYTTPVERYNVKYGKRYRFRVISNGIINCPIVLSIDDHQLLIIASDGSDIEPEVFDSLIVYAGERFDFVLTANQSVDNYWIRAQGLADCNKTTGGVTAASSQAAVLHYDGASSANPSGSIEYNNMAPKKPDGKLLNPFNTQPTNLQVPISKLRNAEKGSHSRPLEILEKAAPDVTYFIPFDFYIIDNYHFHKKTLYPIRAIEKNKHLYSPQFGGISSPLPNYNLYTDMSRINKEDFCNQETMKESNKNCSTEFCECIHRVKFSRNQVIDLVFIDEGVTFDASHPIHIHGHYFAVIGMEKVGNQTSLAEVKELEAKGKLNRENLKNAIWKDTVIVPDGGYTVVRLKTSNPGVWFLHCHLEFHSEIGMALVLQVGDPSDFIKGSTTFPTCGYKLDRPKKQQPPTSSTPSLFSNLMFSMNVKFYTLLCLWPIWDLTQ